MRICKPHWDVCKAAIEKAGLSSLISEDTPKKQIEEAVAVSEGKPSEKPPFDPLMSMNNHWWSVSLEAGGLAMMGHNPAEGSDGHFCPLCELAAHYKEFIVEKQVASIADQMAQYARDQKLIPGVQ